jgi:hypothetical protein
MSVERLEVAASGLSLFMSTFPVMIGQEKEPDSKKKDEEEIKIKGLQMGGEEKQTKKKKHNITNRAA